MFAVVSIAGKQLQVEEGKEYKVELPDGEDKTIKFDSVLAISKDEKTTFGDPYLKDTFVDAEIVKRFLAPKVEVFKFHSKKRYKRTKSQRQHISLIKILKISYVDKK